MADPERFLRNPPSPLALLALRACAEEKPSSAALRRTAKAAALAAATGVVTKSAAAAGGGVKLAAASGATGAAGSAAAAGGGSLAPAAGIALSTVAKWFGLGALGGVLAAPMVTLVPRLAGRQAAPLPAPTLVTAAASNPARATTRGSDTRKLPELPTAALPSIAAPQLDEPKRAAPVPSPALAAQPEAPEQTASALLAAEARFVDQGRAALQRGTLAEALALLDRYEEYFPRQQLLTEVLFLRMEAFSRSGDTAKARGLAARVLAQGVAGPQAARAREVLGR